MDLTFATSLPLRLTVQRHTTLSRYRNPARNLHRTRCALSEPVAPDASRRDTSSLPLVLVVGKFDAFHRGHAELVRVAAKHGAPTLLSFSGMAGALGWAPRAPVVAPVERSRILREWSNLFNTSVGFRALNFADVQHMPPDRFLEFVRSDLLASTIVCGTDWRFGAKAVGNVELLQQLAPKQKLGIEVVPALLHNDEPISSTRVRNALAEGEVEEAAELMGRPHRMVGYVIGVDLDSVTCVEFVNQVVGTGVYKCVIRVLGAAQPVRSTVRVEEREGKPALVTIYDATQVYCEDCEVYIDMISKMR